MVVHMSEEEKRELEEIPLTQEALTVKDAAKYMGVSVRTLWRWMTGGKLRYYQADDHGPVRILKKDLQAMWKPHNREAKH